MRTTRRRSHCSSEDRGYTHRSTMRRQRSARSGEQVFKCKNCRRFITPLPYGGHHRNHCPFCLYSLHVDQQKGDRANECNARMQPIGYFQRPNGEYVLVHQCLGCEFERFNRIAGDDNFELVLSLPEVEPRTSREMKLLRIERALAGDVGEME